MHKPAKSASLRIKQINSPAISTDPKMISAVFINCEYVITAYGGGIGLVVIKNSERFFLAIEQIQTAAKYATQYIMCMIFQYTFHVISTKSFTVTGMRGIVLNLVGNRI